LVTPQIHKRPTVVDVATLIVAVPVTRLRRLDGVNHGGFGWVWLASLITRLRRLHGVNHGRFGWVWLAILITRLRRLDGVNHGGFGWVWLAILITRLRRLHGVNHGGFGWVWLARVDDRWLRLVIRLLGLCLRFLRLVISRRGSGLLWKSEEDFFWKSGRRSQR